MPTWWVQINSAGRTLCGPEWHWTSRNFDWTDYDLWMVVAGRGRMITPEGEFPLQAGVCFVLRGGDFYEGIQDPLARLEVIHIHFDFYMPDGALGTRDWVTARFPLHRKLRDLGIMEQLAQRAVDEWQRERGAVRIDTAAHWLRAALLELRSQDQQADGAHAGRARDSQLQQLCDRLRAEPGRDWRVHEMAAHLHLSPDHFARLFRQHTGRSPQEFRQQARLDRACFLLRFSSDTLGAIATELGFVDVQHFSRFFRERSGASPGHYRRGDPGRRRLRPRP